MKLPSKETIIMVLVGLAVIFVIDYVNVSLCEGVSIPVKCRDYVEYRFS